jgi:hypothetical protein
VFTNFDAAAYWRPKAKMEMRIIPEFEKDRNMDFKNLFAISLSSRSKAARRCFAVLSVMIAMVVCVQNCRGQNVPLSDLVPLQELEVRTNELIQITTTYTDGQRDLRIAQMNLETLTAMSSGTVVSQLEMRIARLNVAVAERKAAVYRAIAEKELAATRAKLEILEQMEKVGERGERTVPAAPLAQNRVSIAQARAMVNILQMILEPLPSK